jgi:hypothetical protein
LTAIIIRSVYQAGEAFDAYTGWRRGKLHAPFEFDAIPSRNTNRQATVRRLARFCELLNVFNALGAFSRLSSHSKQAASVKAAIDAPIRY